MLKAYTCFPRILPSEDMCHLSLLFLLLSTFDIGVPNFLLNVCRWCSEPAPVDRLMQRKGEGAFLQKFVHLFIYLIIQITFRESILDKPILGAISIEVKRQSMSLLSCL